ncbi:MAG: glycosyltransferase family 2 protein [Chlamydiae bacterium]|nr:glycosyltransferase family 2 protein [Chlamydiota bacterium]
MIYYFVLAILGFRENKKRERENQEENFPFIYFSNLTMPVSLIIPARNEEGWIRDSLMSLLHLNYPTFEIIVVDDGSTDRTFEILNEMLDLAALDLTYAKHYKEGPVIHILKSRRHSNVTVIHKTGGHKKAGALNAGLNIAQYNHVCVIDADTILEPDALIKVMAQVNKEPDKVIGIGSSFGLANGLQIKDGRIIKKSFSLNPLIAYQNLEYIRTFIGNRMAWSRFNALPIVAGGFGIWRKDVLYELGGFSAEFTCEDMEITFRMHDYMAKNKDKNYKILMLPHYVGWTEGPSHVKSLIQQRDRWQRVIIETVWKYKYMFCNPKYKGFGFLTYPYFIFYEVLGVFFETASIGFLAIGWMLKILDFNTFLAFLTLMGTTQFLISLLCINTFIRGQRIFKTRYVAYLIFLSAIEFFGYRVVISLAKLFGTYHYLRGVHVYDRYKRAKRH